MTVFNIIQQSNNPASNYSFDNVQEPFSFYPLTLNLYDNFQQITIFGARKRTVGI
ncbi:hypothetical protein SAMN05216294_2123 [Flagellimonas zhangzhouensis]|uniref:Uncharacterized protein n=1 Tax=Flagellimonas zhangzhouensis TaxID=1073328 RepID=A0A1H2RTA3_9FLAO|nr:hypothetical protein SAMN05216294_2123 [Allomuricauda zhangzhouensis]SDW21994.1 hypothetical protein SAMN04487892_0771 [Allomuricauda zhangzhouensis]